MRNKDYVPIDNNSKDATASDVHFPKEVTAKPMAHMTPEELMEFMNALFGAPADAMKDLATAENKEFMNEACDAWDLGNNADPIRPEDLDTFIDETELGEGDCE